MKKLLSISAVILAVMLSLTTSIFAEKAQEESDPATICFDNSSFLNEWLNYGAIDETGFEYKIAETSLVGDGALQITQNVTEAIPDDDQYGGIYLEAEALGLNSFKGCTIDANVLINNDAAEYLDCFSLYSDGIVWMTSDISPEAKGAWTKVSISIPENAANTKIGFLIPIFEPFNGEVALVDEITITTPDGAIIPNVGDMSRSIMVEVEEASLLETIINVVIVVALVAIILMCLIAIISRHNKRYK